MKTSALDYLVEFVNNEKNDLWLKGVVALYLNSNEVIDEADYVTLVDELFAENPKDSELNGKLTAKSDEKNIRLISLSHESGINALAKNQKIVFSNDMTVLYGLNGSGKSSYFRMLQGMIGNILPEQIIPNIYVEKPDVIKGSIDYSIDKANITKVDWYNSNPIDAMTSIRVFDSTYSKAFLGKRESDGQIINPYKLYVFAQLTDIIDNVKALANERIDKEEKGIVSPNLEAFDDITKEILDKPQISFDAISQLETVAKSFDSKKADELSNVEAELRLLSETNYADKKKLIETEYNQAKILKKRVDDLLVSWVNRINGYCEKLTEYAKLKEESEKNRKKIETLKSLPGTKSKAWKDFIQNGLAISAENEELSDCCPYCHQKYDEKALEIVKAYSLEESVAIYPRIVIDPELIGQLHIFPDGPEKSPYWLKQDFDGILYLDYLQERLIKDFGIMIAQEFARYDDRIVEAGCNTRLMQKYIWHANYLKSKLTVGDSIENDEAVRH